SQEPIVVTLWHPHWAYTAFKLKDLKDPKGAMGKPDSIHTIASKDFNSSNPDVTNALKKFHMDDATLSDLEKVVLQENPKDSAKGAEEWVKANPDVVSKMLPDSVDGSGDTVTIGIAAGWAEDVAVTALWKQVLEDHGFTVETKELDVAPVFVGVSKGDLDLFFDTWLPTTHADYWKKYGDQVVDLGVWYDKAPLTITVPTYMKDVNSIADLKKSSVGDEVDWDITGIDPGAGLTKVTKQAMKAYGLD
ncbi:MAG: glycine betaine ABC transporter substrate-binding protein, partial [Nocardioidaceae bacterium]